MMLLNLLNSLKVYIAIALVSILIGAYGAYRLTSTYYVSEIQSASVKAQKEKDAIQQKGDQLVANYVQQIEQISTERSELQKRVSAAVGANNCRVTNGFVRLYNTSTNDVPKTPSSLDGPSPAADTATSQVAETDVLSIAIENNLKYEQVSKQLIDLQNFVNSNYTTVNP
jgi:hypothetical protein